MSMTNSLEMYRKFLFENPTKEKIPAQYKERLFRIRKAFSHWCEFPMKSEVEIRDFLVSDGINRSQAYNDLIIIKALLGNVKNAGKEWHRYRLITMLEEAYHLAIEKQDPKAIAIIADKLGKYTQLHIPDHEQIPWEEIKPQPFEPTSDPSSLGINPDPDIDNKIKKMKEKYMDDIDNNVQDVDFIEIMENDSGKEE